MKIIFLFLFSLNLFAASTCPSHVDLVVIGDSQIGATWSKSYIGNYLQKCLQGDFYIYGRGATTVSSWIGKGSLDKIETIERNTNEAHLNIGNFDQVPLCKKRISEIINTHQPQKIVFNFGGNMITQSDEVISHQIKELGKILANYKIPSERCYFITPSYEMEVKNHRNIPHRNLKNVMHVTEIIKKALNSQCTHISGLELMQDSPYFDGGELLKREIIASDAGCGGAAQNDNVHICGKAAQDFAQRLCSLLN